MVAPTSDIHQKAAGTTERRARSLASHWTTIRPAKTAWPNRPTSTQAAPHGPEMLSSRNRKPPRSSDARSAAQAAKASGVSTRASGPAPTTKAGWPSVPSINSARPTPSTRTVRVSAAAAVVTVRMATSRSTARIIGAGRFTGSPPGPSA